MREIRDRAFWSSIRSYLPAGVALKAIDLGCGPEPRNDFFADECFGIDIATPTLMTVRQADLSVQPIPFTDSFAHVVTAYDFLEHVPRVLNVDGATTFPFVNLMNEVYRVLQTGGLFYSYSPVFPHPKAFEDPTHVNFMTRNTLRNYFCDKSMARIYGFRGSFSLVKQGRKGIHHYALLRKTVQG